MARIYDEDEDLDYEFNDVDYELDYKYDSVSSEIADSDLIFTTFSSESDAQKSQLNLGSLLQFQQGSASFQSQQVCASLQSQGSTSLQSQGSRSFQSQQGSTSLQSQGSTSFQSQQLSTSLQSPAAVSFKSQTYQRIIPESKLETESFTCKICNNVMEDGIIIKNNTICNNCSNKIEPCINCKNIALLNNKCLKCDYETPIIKCYYCKNNGKNGNFINGIFECVDCIEDRKRKHMGFKYCLNCKKHGLMDDLGYELNHFPNPCFLCPVNS